MAESHSEIKPIGGYFELADYEGEHALPIEGGVLLNTGRNALEYILKSIPDIKKVYIPYYTCEVVLEPLNRNNIIFNFYCINNKFEIADDIRLEEGEYLVVNNYFGLKDAYISELAKLYGERLIVDNAQALFAPVLPGIKAFYSTRKFVGVADGGVAVGVDGKYSLLYGEDDSSLHNSHLLIRKLHGAEAGFKKFQQNELKLENQPILRMCNKTRDILHHIDYHRIISCRRANFNFFEKKLGANNILQIPSLNTFTCPMVYPYWSANGQKLRKTFINNNIYVACYWPNVLKWTLSNSLENAFAQNIIPLPIDQRYNEDHLSRILKYLPT